MTWTAPNNTGRPAITGYDLQYRKGSSGTWTDGPQDQTGTSVSIASLDANSAYQVQVRATNADGDSPWSSPPGSGRTANNAPVFTDSTATRSIAETVGDTTVQTAGDVGAAVTAMDADPADTLTYTVEGTDAGKFTIVEGTGQLRTKGGEAYDHEVKASYAVTVGASDGTGSDTIAVTITVTNETERPLTPVAPTVTTTRESTTSLDVTWTAPNNVGRPAITGYDLQYKKSTETDWTDGPQNQTGTSARHLESRRELGVSGADASDQRRRGTAPGQSRGAGRRPTMRRCLRTLPRRAASPRRRARRPSRRPPISASRSWPRMRTTTRSPTPWRARTRGKFGIVSGASGGQLTTKVGEAYDYEALPDMKKSYAVTVKASDGTGSGVITVTINVTNETETPLAPEAPGVTATAGVTMTLEATWTAPDNTGRPSIRDYDLQYKKSTEVNWTAGPQDETGTSASITSLDGNATYEVQVRASNADGAGAWSSPGSGGDGQHPAGICGRQRSAVLPPRPWAQRPCKPRATSARSSPQRIPTAATRRPTAWKAWTRASSASSRGLGKSGPR